MARFDAPIFNLEHSRLYSKEHTEVGTQGTLLVLLGESSLEESPSEWIGTLPRGDGKPQGRAASWMPAAISGGERENQRGGSLLNPALAPRQAAKSQHREGPVRLPVLGGSNPGRSWRSGSSSGL